MDRKFSDAQVERFAKNLLNDFALDDETLNEIAESPKLWWNVRNGVEAEKSRRERRWFFAIRWQIAAFGALAIVFCFGLAGLFLISDNNKKSSVAQENSIRNQETAKAATPKIETKKTESPGKSLPNPEPEIVLVKTVESKAKLPAKIRSAEISTKRLFKSSKNESSAKTANEETKTDFIALSYSQTPDSGQIVRVKVPASMMVSLGVATNIGKESEMVNAEVVIGDDGLARAIRFIR